MAANFEDSPLVALSPSGWNYSKSELSFLGLVSLPVVSLQQRVQTRKRVRGVHYNSACLTCFLAFLAPASIALPIPSHRWLSCFQYSCTPPPPLPILHTGGYPATTARARFESWPRLRQHGDEGYAGESATVRIHPLFFSASIFTRSFFADKNCCSRYFLSKCLNRQNCVEKTPQCSRPLRTDVDCSSREELVRTYCTRVVRESLGRSTASIPLMQGFRKSLMQGFPQNLHRSAPWFLQNLTATQRFISKKSVPLRGRSAPSCAGSPRFSLGFNSRSPNVVLIKRKTRQAATRVVDADEEQARLRWHSLIRVRCGMATTNLLALKRAVVLPFLCPARLTYPLPGPLVPLS